MSSSTGAKQIAVLTLVNVTEICEVRWAVGALSSLSMFSDHYDSFHIGLSTWEAPLEIPKLYHF